MRIWAPSLPPVDRREALRYAGCRDGGEGLPLEACVRMAEEALSCRVLWEEVPVSVSPNGADLGFARTASAGLARALSGCARAVVFAATAGLGMDRLISRYERVSPAHALLLHGIGAERVEALCDAFCAERNRALAPEGLRLLPRYSPGYGDLPLSFQRPLFDFLQCEKRLGLTLTPALLMSPGKSVTAIAGIGAGSPAASGNACGTCGAAACPFRRRPDDPS